MKVISVWIYQHSKVLVNNLLSKIIKYKECIVRALVFQYLQLSFKKSNKGKRKKRKKDVFAYNNYKIKK